VELTPSWGLLALLPFYDQYALSHRIWAPDSRHLTLSGFIADAGQSVPRGEDDTHVYVIDAEGRDAPKAVGQGVMAFWSPK
jgi:TolB protein